MTKEEMINFIKENYCNIEATVLPKMVGCLPTEDRLMNRRQIDELLDKAKRSFGQEFADFLEFRCAKGSVPLGKRRLFFWWLEFENWDYMYADWQQCKEKRPSWAP